MGEAKLSKLSNKNLALSAIKEIEEYTGFHATDIYFTNTYFLFDGPKDSICHFHIKEIPGFLFAFWNTNRFTKISQCIDNNILLWSDQYKVSSKSELLFFTQSEKEIDKFKPSYSDYVQGIYRSAWYEKSEETNRRIKNEEWYLSDVPEILTWMHNHPIKAYVYGGRENIWYEKSDLQCLRYYVKSKFSNWKYDHAKSKQIKKDSKISMKFVRKLKAMDYLVTLSEDCTPSIHIKLAIPDGADEDDIEHDVGLLNKFIDKDYLYTDVNNWFVYNGPEGLTDEQYKEDRDVHKRFYSFAKDVMNIVKGKSKHTLEEYAIDKILAYRLKELEENYHD